MKLVVGLGNPGSQYARTRHNAGFMVVDRLAQRHAPGAVVKAKFGGDLIDASIAGERALLLKPMTYMNRSGQSVGEALRFYKLVPAEDLLVITDDLALPLGAIRIRGTGSPGGHNGLADISLKLGSDDYPRLRFGIDPKPPQMVQADYVLSRFTDDDQAALGPSLDKAAEAVECFLKDGLTRAMNRFNTKIRKTPPRQDAQPGQPQDRDSTRTEPQTNTQSAASPDAEPEKE